MSIECNGRFIRGIDMDATGKKIAQFITDSGYTDKKLGEIMGLSVQSINKWRHGRCLPDIENLFILSQILDVKMDDFLVARATWLDKINEEVHTSMETRVFAYYERLCKVA